MSDEMSFYDSLNNKEMDRYEQENAGKGWETNYIPGSFDIMFTQFLRPNGRKRPVWITVPEDIKKKADQLVNLGYAFECEELRTGEIYMDCCDNDQQLASMLVNNNNMNILQKVIQLVNDAYKLCCPKNTGP